MSPLPEQDDYRTSSNEDDLPISEGELPSGHDLIVLRAFGEDEDAKDLSFQGIRRKLGLHQETLSRSLHRLQRDGYLERLEHAYRISPKGLSTISRENAEEKKKTEFAEPYSVSLLRARLPEDVSISELVEALSFRWFGNLRWLGSTLSPDSAVLSWITSDTGLKMSVRIKDESLTIESAPVSGSSMAEASRAAFELFDHISKAMKAPNRQAGLSARAA